MRFKFIVRAIFLSFVKVSSFFYKLFKDKKYINFIVIFKRSRNEITKGKRQCSKTTIAITQT